MGGSQGKSAEPHTIPTMDDLLARLPNRPTGRSNTARGKGKKGTRSSKKKRPKANKNKTQRAADSDEGENADREGESFVLTDEERGVSGLFRPSAWFTHRPIEICRRQSGEDRVLQVCGRV